jgi:hypothetical protein
VFLTPILARALLGLLALMFSPRPLCIQPEDVAQTLAQLLHTSPNDILFTSAKTGHGVLEVSSAKQAP